MTDKVTFGPGATLSDALAPLSVRGRILRDADALTTSVRNESYGEPYDNLSAIALLQSAYLEAKYPTNYEGLTAEDVAWLNVLQKIARTFHPSFHNDNYIDAAAYAAIAGECRYKEDKV